LCQADLRKLSFLWSEALFEDFGEDGDDEDDFEEVSLFLCRVQTMLMCEEKKGECSLLVLSNIHHPLRGFVSHFIRQHLQYRSLIRT